MKTGIYKILNRVNGKFYIGSSTQSKGIENRWSTHVSRLNRGVHGNAHLQAAWKKYGGDAFTFEVIEYCDANHCLIREQYYLDKMLFASCDDDSFNKLGYNMCRIAGSSRGTKLSASTRRKMSKAKSGEGTHLSKLTRDEVLQIKKLIQQGWTNRMLAIQFGITHSNISKIRRGHTWRSVNV